MCGGVGEWEEAREVPPVCLCCRETFEGMGKGNGRPEGWKVARVPAGDLSTTDFKILNPLSSRGRGLREEVSGTLSQETCIGGEGSRRYMYIWMQNPGDPDPSWSCRSEIPRVLLSIVQRLDDLWGIYS